MLDIEPTTSVAILWLVCQPIRTRKMKSKQKLEIYSLIGPLRIGTRTLTVFVPIKEL